MTETQPAPKFLLVHASLVPREDLIALAESYRKENSSARRWALAGAGFGGLVLSTILSMLGDHFGWPDYLAPYFFAGGWVIMLGSFGILLRQVQLSGRRHQLPCPECGDNLLRDIAKSGGYARAEATIATGTCQSCGAGILTQ